MKKRYDRDDRERLQAILGSRMRAARKALKLTQRETARQAGMCKEYYARIERGHGMPGVGSLAKIADVLRLSADYMLGFDVHASPIRAPTSQRLSWQINEIVDRARNDRALTRIILDLLKLCDKN